MKKYYRVNINTIIYSPVCSLARALLGDGPTYDVIQDPMANPGYYYFLGTWSGIENRTVYVNPRTLAEMDVWVG